MIANWLAGTYFLFHYISDIQIRSDRDFQSFHKCKRDFRLCFCGKNENSRNYIPFLTLNAIWLWLFLFKRYLKDATEGACFISSGRLFQALIAEGKKKNYKKDLYSNETSEYRLSCEDYMAPFPGQEEG